MSSVKYELIHHPFISVEDALPADGLRVMAFQCDGTIEVCACYDEGAWFDENDWYIYDVVGWTKYPKLIHVAVNE